MPVVYTLMFYWANKYISLHVEWISLNVTRPYLRMYKHMYIYYHLQPSAWGPTCMHMINTIMWTIDIGFLVSKERNSLHADFASNWLCAVFKRTEQFTSYTTIPLLLLPHRTKRSWRGSVDGAEDGARRGLWSADQSPPTARLLWSYSSCCPWHFNRSSISTGLWLTRSSLNWIISTRISCFHPPSHPPQHPPQHILRQTATVSVRIRQSPSNFRNLPPRFRFNVVHFPFYFRGRKTPGRRDKAWFFPRSSRVKANAVRKLPLLFVRAVLTGTKDCVCRVRSNWNIDYRESLAEGKVGSGSDCSSQLSDLVSLSRVLSVSLSL